ncbi:DNA-directed RNA polymerase iv subunit 1 [Phtheirospermum japonicum]|uniref:DNA-directed RNA polymerase subunit n=1 Tax=Phtheirospermum japonicum TaxID=374723 RepID=A0A830CPD3_9LAMI|nr:DNA-directed RNA polymerase iv subunit 1 [Phtheirospermum japonicum]
MDRDLHIAQPVTFARLKGVHLSILSDEDAGKISERVIGSVNEVSDASLGLPTPNATECATCGSKNSRDCEGHFGLIKFPCTILNPYFMSEIAQILNKICPRCKSCKAKQKGNSSNHQPRLCKYCCSGTAKYGYPKMKFRVSSKDVFAKSAIIVEVQEKFVDKSSDLELASDYWDVIPKDTAQVHNGLPLNKRVLSPAQVYTILKDVSPAVFEQTLNRRNSIFLNTMLVTPNSHRVKEFGQRITNDETTKMYRKLIDFRGSPNELSARLRSEKLSNLQRAYEKQSSNESASSSSGLRNIKDLLLGKRTDHSFRMVVVGDPMLKVSEIGLPAQIAENVLISDHINVRNWGKLEQCCDFMLKERGNFSVLRNAQTVTIWSKDMLREGDLIRRHLLDGDIVLINRPPSIHQHSLIALSVKILPIYSVMSINPLICNPLRGDFDGDCLHGYVPQSVNSRVELSELVSLDRQLLNGQNGRNLLSFNQDSLTGAHLLLEDGVTLNKAEIQQMQMFCSCRPVVPGVVKSGSVSNLWTGKQLFSLLLPPDFEFSYASNGVCVRHGEVVSSSHGSFWLNDSNENLFQCLVRHYREKVLDFLSAGQEMFCEWLMRRGLSVSLSDLYLSSDTESRKNLLDDIKYGLQEAEKLSEIGLVMVGGNEHLLIESSDENENMERIMSKAQQSKVEFFQASVSASKSAIRDMQNLVYKHSGKNNSFIAMLKAGSKGNLQKLFQHSMCVGLQHTLAPVAFPVPRGLTCASWNDEKSNYEISDSFIPCTMVGSSFLAGLNPLECFMLSLTTRDSTFGGHADVSGTLTRKLMFFMRDLMIGYDGTVRSNHGNHVVQFNYCTEDNVPDDAHGDGSIGGHPVGPLAACAISEAAYSALDQPVSVLESSPLLNLKKVLECGVKRNTGFKSASLFLSKRLGRWANGFEYGALEVKDHLECLIFSDVVSKVKICFSNKTNSSTTITPWACHFHINKEVAKRRRLTLRSVINALHVNSKRVKSKIKLPKLHITSKACSELDTDEKSDSVICITVALTASLKGISEASLKGISDLDILRDFVKPILLQTVIKGFPEFKKVEILWKESKDKPSDPKSTGRSSGEPFLRVVMSDYCDRIKFWSIVIDKSLRLRNIIDWDRSHPDDIRDCGEAYGIDVAWQCFVNDLHSAIDDTGKTILPEHLLVTASCLSATGEFVPISAKGLAHQRKEANINSPFTHACFSNPSDCLVKAAKMGQTDGLQGSLEALAWGQTPSIGTGCHFDIMYNGKGHEPAKPTDVYSLLSSHVGRAKPIDPLKHVLGESITSSHFNTTKRKSLLNKMVKQRFSEVGIKKISQRLRRMLKAYPMNSKLKEQDKSTAMTALQFHPRWEAKVGKGVLDIKVGCHPDHKQTCFFLVRIDGTEEDFSYIKCINHALELISPEKANAYPARKEKVAHNPAVELV